MESFASVFLWIVGTLFLFAFALPLLFAPFAWARAFRWKLPEETHLTLYLGRCLGAVGVAITATCFRAATAPKQHLLFFEVLAISGALLLSVHIWGAIRRQQPWTETAEILLFAAATAGALWIRLGL